MGRGGRGFLLYILQYSEKFNLLLFFYYPPFYCLSEALIKGYVFSAGNLFHLLKRYRAYAAGRHIYYPFQAYGVARVYRHPEIRKRILYLLPFIKPYSPDYRVGHPFPYKMFFKDP